MSNSLPGTSAGPSAGYELTEQVFRAHAAVLSCHQAIQERILSELTQVSSAGPDPTAVANPPVTPGVQGMQGVPGVTGVPEAPSHGEMSFIGRVMEFHGTQGMYTPGSRVVTEYDVPADPWYARDYTGPALPMFVTWEIALQAAAIVSGRLGAMSGHSTGELLCRNLSGHGVRLRNPDTRSGTVQAQVTLVSSNVMPDALLHRYEFQLRTGGEVFYSGEMTHGLMTRAVLDTQRGLDGDRHVPPWLDRQPPETLRAARHIVLGAGARPLGGSRVGDPRLELLDEVEVLAAGGEYGCGYARGRRVLDADDWYFLAYPTTDVTLPGSLAVEMLFQAVRAWAAHTGLADTMPDGWFFPAVGQELRWNHRGQVVPGNRDVRCEAHIREVRRESGRLVVIADGSVYCEDLRIHKVDGIAVELASPR